MKNVCLNETSMVNFSSRQRGASLLEGIAYLGIAALVVLGAVSLLTGAFSSAQSNRGAEEIVSIRTGVKKLYMGQANSYGNAEITGTLITAGVLPTTLGRNGAALVNAWGGGVTVTGVNNRFTIVYTAVPQDACVGMLSGASGWDSIASGAVTVNLFPIAPADAIRLCGVAVAAGNAITLTSL